MKQKKTTTNTTTSAKGSKPKKLSLGEFRAWLSGVEEMQADDWSPDLTQWRRIREKIDDIVDSPRSFNSGGAGPSQEFDQPAPRVLRPAGPSLMSPAALGPQPPPPSFMTADPGSKARTPNIDTSDGGYSSSLE